MHGLIMVMSGKEKGNFILNKSIIMNCRVRVLSYLFLHMCIAHPICLCVAIIG